jgi:hypothetical protein
MVNDPYSAFLALGRQTPVFRLARVQGLDGYLAAVVMIAGMELAQIVDPGENSDRARMCLKIPFDNGWGLNDLLIDDRDGEEWVIWGSVQYRPLATVSPLGWGRGSVTIGHEGLGEWRWMPAASAMTLAGAASWYLYDAEFALLEWGLREGTVGAVAGGSYLLLHGAPCTTITLTVEP